MTTRGYEASLMSLNCDTFLLDKTIQNSTRPGHTRDLHVWSPQKGNSMTSMALDATARPNKSASAASPVFFVEIGTSTVRFMCQSLNSLYWWWSSQVGRQTVSLIGRSVQFPRLLCSSTQIVSICFTWAMSRFCAVFLYHPCRLIGITFNLSQSSTF